MGVAAGAEQPVGDDPLCGGTDRGERDRDQAGGRQRRDRPGAAADRGGHRRRGEVQPEQAPLGFLGATGLALVGRFALGTELISAHITPGLIIGALLFSFILGSFFGTLPAIRAAQLNPVDALRFTK